MTNTLTEHFDTGPQGANVTTANTSLSAVTLTNGGTSTDSAVATFDAAHKVAGAFCVKLKLGNGVDNGNIFLRHDIGSLVSTRFARFYVTVESLPLAMNLLVADAVATSTNRAQVQITTTGTVRIRNGVVTVAETATTLAAGSPVRIEWDLTGTTQTLRLFTGANVNGTVPDETITGAQTQGTFDRLRFGATASYSGNLWIDELAVDSTTSPGTAVTGPSTNDQWELKFEGGTNGAAATAANTGTTVAPAGGGTTIFTTGVLEGLGLKVSVAAAQNEQLRHDNSAGLVSTYNYRVYMRAVTPISFPRYFMQVTAAGTIRAQVGIGPDGTLRLRNGTATVATSNIQLPSNELVRIGWTLDSVAGTQSARIYVGGNIHGTTPDETVTGPFSTGTFDRFNFGVNNSEAEAWDVYFDNVAGNASQVVGPASFTSAAKKLRASSGVRLMRQAGVTPPPPPPPPPPSGTFLAGAIVGARDGTEAGVPSVVKSADQELVRLETLIGAHLQIRRTYEGSPPPASFANCKANADVGKRASSISVRSDPRDMANGVHNARVTSLIKSVPLGHKLFITWQHEPENDAAPGVPVGYATRADYNTAYRAGGNVFGKTVKAARLPGQDITVAWCMMGWTFVPASGRDPLDYWWGDDAVELVAPDPYMYSETAYKAFSSANVGALQAWQFAKAHGKRFGINEWGSLDHPGSDRPRFQKEGDTWLRSLTNPVCEFSCWYHDVDKPPDGVGCWVDTLNSSPGGTLTAGSGVEAFSMHIKNTVP
jgi:hypothetical protein